jgi:cell wall-associated NlpC family hydrolase
VFAQDKAGAAAFADTLPDIQALQAKQLMAQLLAGQSKDTQALAAQRAEIEAKRPGLLQDALKELMPTATSAKGPQIRNFADGTTRQYNPVTGKWQVLATKPPKTPSFKAPTIRNFTDGTSRQYNPQTGGWDVISVKKGSPASKSGAKGGAGSTPSGKPISFSAASDYAQSMTANSNTVWKVRKRGGGYEAFDTRKKKAGGAGAGASSSSVSTTVNRATTAGTAALNTLTARVWAATPGSGVDPKKDPQAFATAKKNAQIQLTKSFGSAMYRVISAIGPHLKAIGYSQAAIKSKAYEMVSAVITPPPNYKRPKSVQMGKGEAANAAYTAQKANNVISFAGSQIGKPYVWGSGPDFKSFDCSDLIQASYKAVGVNLPRTTYGQIKAGKPVSLDQIQPGDLVFPSKGHVVLYVGGGKVIAAPHTGALVQFQDLAHFGNPVAIRRVLPDRLSYA